MNDPRDILCEELIKAGIEKKLAFSIALDAGSSQSYVDLEYVRDLNVNGEIEQIIFDTVSRFYFGYYNDKQN